MSDLIKREDVMALWDKYHYEIATKAVEFDNGLRAIPSAEPKHGKWVYHYRLKKFVCLECGYEQKHKPEWKYCPNCGARMDG